MVMDLSHPHIAAEWEGEIIHISDNYLAQFQKKSIVVILLVHKRLKYHGIRNIIEYFLNIIGHIYKNQIEQTDSYQKFWQLHIVPEPSMSLGEGSF